MGIVNAYLNRHAAAVDFDVDALSDALRRGLPQVEFCLLLGSAVDGIVRPHSDLDLAFYLDERGKADCKFYDAVFDIVEAVIPGIACDIGILNKAEPVFCFEALKGRLLFSRNMECYLRFYSLTCREYESQMQSYERQLRYRRECRNAL